MSFLLSTVRCVLGLRVIVTVTDKANDRSMIPCERHRRVCGCSLRLSGRCRGKHRELRRVKTKNVTRSLAAFLHIFTET